MLVIAKNNVKTKGIIIGEDIVIKTRAIDKYLNQKVLIIELLTITKAQYLGLKTIPEEQLPYITINYISLDGMPFIEQPFDTTLAVDWQAQNELVKQKLIEQGVPEDAIQIVEDIAL